MYLRYDVIGDIKSNNHKVQPVAGVQLHKPSDVIPRPMTSSGGTSNMYLVNTTKKKRSPPRQAPLWLPSSPPRVLQLPALSFSLETNKQGNAKEKKEGRERKKKKNGKPAHSSENLTCGAKRHSIIQNPSHIPPPQHKPRQWGGDPFNL